MCCFLSCCLFFVYENVVVLIYVYFFFCKQKTAYEMRISDWSSYVCSSDLGGVEAREVGQAGVAFNRCVDDGFVDAVGVGERAREQGCAAENGRASCRARVCHYV